MDIRHQLHGITVEPIEKIEIFPRSDCLHKYQPDSADYTPANVCQYHSRQHNHSCKHYNTIDHTIQFIHVKRACLADIQLHHHDPSRTEKRQKSTSNGMDQTAPAGYISKEISCEVNCKSHYKEPQEQGKPIFTEP